MDALLNEDDLQEIVIDLTAQLNESELMLMGAKIKWMLGAMFGDSPISATVRGTSRQVRSFGKALSGEKKYMDAYTRYGLNDARTYKSKVKLNYSIKNFERATGLKWPIG